MLRFLLPAAFLWMPLLVTRLDAGNYYFEFTANARQAYDKVTSLRFGEAYPLLAKMKLEDPDNLIVYHIENYIDFFQIYLQENEADYDKLKKNRDDRLEKIQRGNTDSPYYLYVQADIRLQWALARLRFDDYIGAFTEVSKAHKLLQQNSELFPKFMPNKKDLGVLHAMVGTIPDEYKWGVKLLGGLEGTIAQGRKEVEEVLKYAEKNDFIFEKETIVLYAFLLLHLENKEEDAWQTVNTDKLKPKENPMHCFVMANIAQRTGHNERAIQLLESRPKGKLYYDFPYLDYMLGLSKLRRLDQDAGAHFTSYLSRYKGRHFVKEAYQKLAWQELLNGNKAGYTKYMKDCLLYGYAVSGGDKNAEDEAKSGQTPDLSLLKSRLLFDGGYYEKGLETLRNRSPESFASDKEKVEYHYRMGRLLHGNKQYSDAINSYQKTLDLGSDKAWFFACNAALQMGLIYEKQANKTKAKTYFEKCLSLKPDEYKTSLHQKAKAGLARL
ncbi:MAG TPA: hypothetical protein PKA00_14485 [Saprospiraceae bacterium]|nr:hypothetical protein [Saprospiraceae bacterium]HMQ84117.1 hypothetical protein [Saprospiraceae bacterium]